MKIVNRDVDFGNICQRINTNNNICNLTNEEEKRISFVIEKLTSDGRESYSMEELSVASEIVKKERLSKTRILEKKDNGGFVLISSLTCIGTLIVGTIIFMTIKLFVIG